MIDAVFISDLHLHPNEPLITSRFNSFVNWALNNTRSVYILGDFFHAWPGDDALDEWSCGIAMQLASLAKKGINLYFMHGNRDFLLGSRFWTLAQVTFLSEPTVITLDNMKVLLVHGDRYCTKDTSHQWLRRVTRNPIFSTVFLKLPFSFRQKLVNSIRQHSQLNTSKSPSYMDVVPATLLHHMQQMDVKTLVHGHTHKPGLTQHQYQGSLYRHFVLSDWDDNPLLLCYDNPNGFYFRLFLEY